MSVLATHQRRIEALRNGLDRLLALHRRAHDLNAQSIAAAKSSDPGKEQQVLALRAKTHELSREIAALRKSLEPLAALRKSLEPLAALPPREEPER